MGRPRTKTDVGSTTPTTEIGVQVRASSPVGIPGIGGTAPWTTFMDEHEYVPELRWPDSVRTYDQMRTDSQLAGLLTAVLYGITQLRFVIEPNGAPDSLVQEVSEDLNLPIKGEEDSKRRRMKRRFSHRKHLLMALKAMIWGHMYFEQVGEIVDGKWRLRKLAPRMPHTLAEIKVAEDGGLISIRQNISSARGVSAYGGWAGQPELPVDRLVAFIFEQEGANWVGRSIMRDCFKNWLVKDKLVRVDLQNHERAGGIPIGTAAPESTPNEVAALSVMMQQLRQGETAGGAVPPGAEVDVLKSGGRSSVFDSIRGHDELMARRFLLMLMNLAQGGQHVGSFALGEIFHDTWATGQKAIVSWYTDTMNEHVIEDIADWNYGEDEELAPLLEAENMDEVLNTEALAQLVDSDVIVVDDELEDTIRYRYKLPKRSKSREELLKERTEATKPPAPPPGEGGGDGSAPSPSKPSSRGGDA